MFLLNNNFKFFKVLTISTILSFSACTELDTQAQGQVLSPESGQSFGLEDKRDYGVREGTREVEYPYSYLPIHNLSYRGPNGFSYRNCRDFDLEGDIGNHPLVKKIFPKGVTKEVDALEYRVSTLMLENSRYWTLPFENRRRIDADLGILEKSYLEDLVAQPRAGTKGFHIMSEDNSYYSFARDIGVAPGFYAGRLTQTVSRNISGRVLSASVQQAPAKFTYPKADSMASCLIQKDLRIKAIDSAGNVIDVPSIPKYNQQHKIMIRKHFEKTQTITEVAIGYTSNRLIKKGEVLRFAICRGMSSNTASDCNPFNGNYLGTFEMIASQDSLRSQVNTASPLTQVIYKKVVPVQ